MPEKKPENPPAFPEVRTTNIGGQTAYIQDSNSIIRSYGGMTLRDYFAAKAMPIVSPPDWDHSDKDGAYFLAKQAYQFADAMLRARQGGAL